MLRHGFCFLRDDGAWANTFKLPGILHSQIDILPWIDRAVSLYIVVCYSLTHNIWFVRINHQKNQSSASQLHAGQPELSMSEQLMSR